MLIRFAKLPNSTALDTSVKSASTGKLLAPSWDIVGGHKRWQDEQDGYVAPDWTLRYAPVDDVEYARRYIKLLRNRYAQDKAAFETLLNCDELVLGCYCVLGNFCHRELAAIVLMLLGGQCGLQVSVEWPDTGRAWWVDDTGDLCIFEDDAYTDLSDLLIGPFPSRAAAAYYIVRRQEAGA